MSAADALAQLALVAAALASAAATLLTLGERRRPGLARPARILWTSAALLAALSFAWLVRLFLAADLRVAHVFFYTRTDLEWPWRLAGAWAGREGSMLLWTVAMAATTAAFAWSHGRGGEGAEPGRRVARAVLGLLGTCFLAAAALQDTFAPTPSALLQGRPLGNGLNPTLQSGFILVHPPLMFVAYALAAVPAAAAAGHLLTGSGTWSRVTLAWTRAGWLVATVAIGLGSAWAYLTLGFGGYWSWDPVEVANLLPWLAFTILLHAQLLHAREGRFAGAGPLLALLPFVLTLFSTLSTRSGLWVSVHAFTDPTDTFEPDAAARFMSILEVEPSLRFHLGLAAATLLGGLALWSRRLAEDQGVARPASRAVAAILGSVAALFALAPRAAMGLVLEAARRTGDTGYGLLGLTFAAVAAAGLPSMLAREPPERAPRRLDLAALASLAVLGLGLGLVVLFLFHMAAVNGWSTEFYEARFPYLAAPILLGLVAMPALGLFGARRALAAVAVAATAGLAALLLLPHRGGALLATLAVAAALLGLERARRAGAVGSARARAGAALLLLAGLLDLLFWLDPPTRIGLGGWSLPSTSLLSVPLAAASLGVLWLGARILVGAPAPAPGLAFLAAGLLGGFGVAPVAALVGWLLWRGGRLEPSPLHAKARARLRQVGLYGAHAAVAILLLGYAPSTYLREAADLELERGGEAGQVAGLEVELQPSVATGPAGRAATGLAPSLGVSVPGRGPDRVAPGFGWEEGAQAHYPTPATHRRWLGDLYLSVEAVRLAPGCIAEGGWVEAYRPAPARPCTGDAIEAVRVRAVALPGIGLVWLGIALMAGSMLLLAAFAQQAREPALPPPSVHQEKT